MTVKGVISVMKDTNRNTDMLAESGIVYIATNTIDGKIYIGQTVQNFKARITSHQKQGNFFFNAIHKHGIECFKWEILRYCNSIEEMNVFEEYYILYYGSTNRMKGYNLTSGGKNFFHSKESIEKMSGKNHYNYGKKVSKTQRETMSQAQLKRYKVEKVSKHIENQRLADIKARLWDKRLRR